MSSVEQYAKWWRCACGQGNGNGRDTCGGCHKPRLGQSIVSMEPHSMPVVPGARKGSRKLRKHREPNETERDFGFLLEARKRAGEIVSYEFEGITLRWADMEYTPDYPVIVRQEERRQDDGWSPVGVATGIFMVEFVFVELKGGYRHEDSVIKFKSFREAFSWAKFEMWQRAGRGEKWEQVA